MEQAIRLLTILEEAGFEAFIIGRCARHAHACKATRF